MIICCLPRVSDVNPQKKHWQQQTILYKGNSNVVLLLNGHRQPEYIGGAWRQPLCEFNPIASLFFKHPVAREFEKKFLLYLNVTIKAHRVIFSSEKRHEACKERSPAKERKPPICLAVDFDIH